MTVERFDLYRRIKVVGRPTIITSLSVFRRCDDPQKERFAVANDFPKFGVSIHDPAVKTSSQYKTPQKLDDEDTRR